MEEVGKKMQVCLFPPLLLRRLGDPDSQACVSLPAVTSTQSVVRSVEPSEGRDPGQEGLGRRCSPRVRGCLELLLQVAHLGHLGGWYALVSHKPRCCKTKRHRVEEVRDLAHLAATFVYIGASLARDRGSEVESGLGSGRSKRKKKKKMASRAGPGSGIGEGSLGHLQVRTP